MIKKIILFAMLTTLCFASMERFAQENGYHLKYQEALTLSKQTGKPILLVIVTTTCPWCEKLKKQTLQKEAVKEVIAKNYIPLIVNKERALYPINKFEAKVVPTVYIVNGATQEIVNSSYGYKVQHKFLEFLQN